MRVWELDRRQTVGGENVGERCMVVVGAGYDVDMRPN